MTERVWQPIHTAPRDGTWFLARTESGYERHVHFADARDRLPIDHKSGLWTTLPVEWCLDPAFQPPEPQPAASASEPLDQLRPIRDRLGKYGDLFMRLNGFYRIGPDGPVEPELGYRDFRDSEFRQPIQSEAAQALADLSAVSMALVEALRWYGGAVAECRKPGVYGDQARKLLDQDGGKQAEAALAVWKGSN